MGGSSTEGGGPACPQCPAARAEEFGRPRLHGANRFQLDYAIESQSFTRFDFPIIDAHAHINGTEAASIYKRAAELYGVGLTYSMTHLEQLEGVRAILGDRIRFIAVPNWMAEDKRYHLGRGYIKRIEQYHARGARIVKFFAAPRATDYAVEWGDPDGMKLDAPERIETMEAASALGMIFMTHVGDPDTWFAAKYTDSDRYGTKLQQYEPFEALLDRFTQPWIAAHMGGWPENIEFLTGLLERHPNLHLDTSAAKWMIRELSRHPRSDLLAFLRRFRGRVLFGSDIVSTDDHLVRADSNEMAAKAGSPSQAFDLYASRYWSLRTLFETRYIGESPIADPDLEMTQPERYGPTDAPALVGKSVPADLLRSLYHDAAGDLLEPVFRDAAAAPAGS